MRAAEPLVRLGRDWPSWSRPFAAVAERLLGLSGVNELYARAGGQGLSAPQFCQAILDVLGVETVIEPEGLQRLKDAQGPVLVTANHPLGGRDALLMNVVLGAARPDYRILANQAIGAVPETRAKLFLVDPFGGSVAAAANRGALRQATRWLGSGGLLGVFPAGEVSWWQAEEGRVADKAWAPQAVRLAQASGAQIVPLHFSGESSKWLRALAWVHPALKTPWLARELLSGPAKRLEARLGVAVNAQSLPGLEAGSQAAWLRERTYALAPSQHRGYRGHPNAA